ncbi:MAG: hypothetical protein SO098_04040, partial [Prevotella sp.]|nr:hypothetical protein [Prevotella sp.]
DKVTWLAFATWLSTKWVQSDAFFLFVDNLSSGSGLTDCELSHEVCRYISLAMTAIFLVFKPH